MGICKSLFFAVNPHSRDLQYYLNPVFKKEGFEKVFSWNDSKNHILYSNGKMVFDFWWVHGSRPTLFLRNNGEQIKTTVYDSLIEKYAPKESIGGKIHFLNSKLDREIYYKEHELFIIDYIKNN